jgi:hypothetical protein
MEKLFGLWVDHEKAIIISLIDGSHKVTHVESDIEGGNGKLNSQYYGK